jgi:hypothetical protein
MSKKEEKIFSIADYPVRTGVHFIGEKKGGPIYQTGARAPNKSELAAAGLELFYEFEIRSASEAELILKWARCGDWNSLADYLADGGCITDAIRVFLIEVLRQRAGKPNNRAASLRTLDAPGGVWHRVLYFIMLLEDGLGREKAITATAERFGVNRRTISRNIRDEEAAVDIMRRTASRGVIKAAAAGPRYLISSTALTPHFMS